MDRLVVIIPNGCYEEIAVLQRKDDGVPYYREWNASTDIALEAALRRLVAYERTGLTPEQVVEMQAENARLTKEMDRAKHKVADLFEKSDELVEEQSAFIDELQAQLRVAEKVCYAAHMYVKNSNSPLCTGWDMLLDALQKWVDGKRGPQGGEGGVHSAEASP